MDPAEIARFQTARLEHQKQPWVGFKGQEFVLRCKLQSHGSFKQLKDLRERMAVTAETVEDIDVFSEVTHPDGYPIYLLFEVIHVYRLQDQDRRERHDMIAFKL